MISSGCNQRAETAVQTPEAAPIISAVPVKAPAVSAYLKRVISWNTDAGSYSQYRLILTTDEDYAITSWKTEIKIPEGMHIVTGWHCYLQKKTSDTLEISSDSIYIPSSDPVGFIASGDSDLPIQSCEGITEKKLNSPVMSKVNGIMDSSYKAAWPSGPLHVSGGSLVNQTGQKVQLKGASTQTVGWFPEYINASTFRSLRDNWNVNIVRLVVYTEDYSGWCTDGNRDEQRTWIDRGVQAATQLGMYVIIDWHVLKDNNPMVHADDAKAFFAEMSARYQNHDNIFYEICNEPDMVSWSKSIKPYAEEIIPIIRANDPDAIVLVGSNKSSTQLSGPLNDPLPYDNVMYTFHFYAGTHQSAYRYVLKSAAEKGLPIFVSECGITKANGIGALYKQSGQAWMDLLNQYDISWISWSLCSEDSSSCLFKAGDRKLADLTNDDLSESGKWFAQEALN